MGMTQYNTPSAALLAPRRTLVRLRRLFVHLAHSLSSVNTGVLIKKCSIVHSCNILSALSRCIDVLVSTPLSRRLASGAFS